MILFAATLPIGGLLLHSCACLCIRLVLETRTFALIISSGRRLVKVKYTLGLVQELKVRGACGRRWRECFDCPILLEVILLDRHVAHKSTLWRSDLVKELPLVADFYRKHLGLWTSIERIVLLF